METVIGILPSEAEDQRLELVLEKGRLALKFSVYSEGLGWQSQKRIYIEAQQAEELQFLLGGASHLLKQSQAGEDGSISFSAAQKRLHLVKSPQSTTAIRRSA